MIDVQTKMIKKRAIQMAEYEIGSIVVKKNRNKSVQLRYVDKFVFMGTIADTSNGCELKMVHQVTEVAGNIEIGIFVKKPFYIEEAVNQTYKIPVIMSNTELFEKYIKPEAIIQ